jgi:hypothetical protein
MIDFLAEIGAISIGVAVAVAASTAWTRKPPAGRDSTDVWIDERDQKRFAGMWVAVDSDTNELVSAGANREIVESDLRLYHPERRCDVVSIPGEPSEPLRVLLGVGGCERMGGAK